MILYAYAKVNLILKVVGKLDNGYHQLQMINSKINLYDKIKITKTNCDDQVIFTNITQPHQNLVLDSLKTFKKTYNIKDNFKITIKKNIPLGSGMGGGSSDVATIINYLQKKYQITKDEKFLNLFNSLGTDIKYFFFEGTRYIEGIGDKVKDKIDFKNHQFVILYPNININTASVFKNHQENSLYVDKTVLIKDYLQKGYNSYYNELEKTTFAICPKLKDIKVDLENIGYPVMTGSGSTMMIFGNQKKIYQYCKKKYPKYIIKKVKLIKE